MNEWVHKFGIWLTGGLLTLNWFFVQRIISSVDESKIAISLLQSNIALLQSNLKGLEASTAGMTDLRVQFAILQTRMESLTEAVKHSGKRKGE